MEHILAGCPGLAQRQYLWRHNDALKHVLNVILLQYGLREKPLGPYQPNSYYRNDEIEIMWDCKCSITTSSRPPGEGNRPDICVTNHTDKEIRLLEMACPSWRNREATEERKTSKYRTVREELKERHPGYKIQQINLIVDVLGGYDKQLTGKLDILIGRNETTPVLFEMQKTIWIYAIRPMSLVSLLLPADS